MVPPTPGHPVTQLLQTGSPDDNILILQQKALQSFKLPSWPVIMQEPQTEPEPQHRIVTGSLTQGSKQLWQKSMVWKILEAMIKKFRLCGNSVPAKSTHRLQNSATVSTYDSAGENYGRVLNKDVISISTKKRFQTNDLQYVSPRHLLETTSW